MNVGESAANPNVAPPSVNSRRMRYRRTWEPGGTYFFTVAIAERRRSLLTDHVDDLRHAFRVARAARPFTVDAVVILPDHMHCLWTLPPGDADDPIRWAHLKQAFYRRIPTGEGLKVHLSGGTREADSAIESSGWLMAESPSAVTPYDIRSCIAGP